MTPQPHVADDYNSQATKQTRKGKPHERPRHACKAEYERKCDKLGSLPCTIFGRESPGPLIEDNSPA